MEKHATVGLICDYDPSVPAHQAIPLALERAASAARIELEFEWVPTDEVTGVSRIAAFHGLWCVPASPIAAWTARCSRYVMRAKAVFPSSAPAAGFSRR